jgi:scyllo-inositol 2-dehydrogenase (NADP+)
VFAALHLFGRPDWVYADISRQRRGAEVDDCFDITLAYDGFRARVGASMSSAKNDLVFRVSGEHATYEKHGLDPQEAMLRAGGVPGSSDARESSEWGADDGSTITDETGTRPIDTVAGDYPAYYASVAESIRRGAARAPTNAVPARNTIAVLEAAFESDREGRRVEPSWRY